MGDRCEKCGFDERDYDEQDARNTLKLRDALWDHMSFGRDAEALDMGPMPDDLHGILHHLHEAGRALRDAPTQQGTVVQLNASDGGVPKSAVDAVEVGQRGVIGDRQNSREHHGRPWQALCLWSDDVIGQLRAEGHPIEPGYAGENVTIGGIDWTTIRPGTRLLLGEVMAEVTCYSLPCKKNAGWFIDGDFRRMDHERHPGWSRVYASVIETGRIATGDAVVVEP